MATEQAGPEWMLEYESKQPVRWSRVDEASLWLQRQLQPVSSSPLYYVIALCKLTKARADGPA